MTSVLIDNKGLDVWLIIQTLGISSICVILGIVSVVWLIEKFIKKDHNGR